MDIVVTYLKNKIMTKQSENLMNLCKGSSIDSIKTAMNFARESSVKEIAEHLGINYSDKQDAISKIAQKLS